MMASFELAQHDRGAWSCCKAAGPEPAAAPAGSGAASSTLASSAPACGRSWAAAAAPEGGSQGPLPCGGEAASACCAPWLAGAPRAVCAATLELEGRLGAGGPGAGLSRGAAVFRGRWHRAPAAIKVCYCGPHHQAPGRVMEMAVLGAVRHPNIPALYACYTDVAAEGLGAAAPPLLAAPSPQAAPRAHPAPALLHLRPLAPADEAGRCCYAHPAVFSEPTACDVIVTEFCDRGTLAAALASGALDAAAACCLLLDVAAALACLHGLRITHGAVCAESVLLKTDPLRPGGLVAKLSGLSSCRLHDARGRPLHLRVSDGAFESDDGAALPPAAAMGQRPSALLAAGGHGCDIIGAGYHCGSDSESECDSDCSGCAWSGPAEDVHAFGSLVWRVFTSLGPRGAGAGPGGVAPWAAAVAAACWAPHPRDRPAIRDAAHALERAAALAIHGFAIGRAA